LKSSKEIFFVHMSGGLDRLLVSEKIAQGNGCQGNNGRILFFFIPLTIIPLTKSFLGATQGHRQSI
jgi:hypothetical protein